MNKKNSSALALFIQLAQTEAILSHRFDRGLGGLGFSEFLILHHLSSSKEEVARRVDLAEKVALTPSGVTRLLLVMEKVHLIESGPVERDARVRTVRATAAGKEKYQEALERLELFAEEIMPSSSTKDIDDVTQFLLQLGGNARIK